MTPRLLLLALMLLAAPAVGIGQTFTPQSPAGLSVTFTTEASWDTPDWTFFHAASSKRSCLAIGEPFRLRDRADTGVRPYGVR